MEHNDEGSASGPSHLVNFMQSTYPLPSTSQPQQQLAEEVTTRFWNEFKVTVKTETPYLLFKYDQILCERWDLPMIHECRGIILCMGSTGWRLASWPFNKFFNQGEGKSPVANESEFNRLCDQFMFCEKADGTCVQLWCDHAEDENKEKPHWRISTLGTITPDEWVPKLFWKLLDKYVVHS